MSWATADFDGDERLDIAAAHFQGYANAGYSLRVEIEFSAGGARDSFSLSSWYEGLSLAAPDVDGDRDPDLVFTSAVFHEPVAVWLNDGRGGFRPARLDWRPAACRNDDDSISHTRDTQRPHSFTHRHRRSLFLPPADFPPNSLVLVRPHRKDRPAPVISLLGKHQQTPRGPPSTVARSF